jgi:hypothetical protein
VGLFWSNPLGRTSQSEPAFLWLICKNVLHRLGYLYNCCWTNYLIEFKPWICKLTQVILSFLIFVSSSFTRQMFALAQLEIETNSVIDLLRLAAKSENITVSTCSVGNVLIDHVRWRRFILFCPSKEYKFKMQLYARVKQWVCRPTIDSVLSQVHDQWHHTYILFCCWKLGL